MAVYRPLTLPMPDPRWGVSKDMTRGGFTRPLTAEDLALDPERVLMQGTVHDNLAAAIVDAEESAGMTAISERQDPRAAEAETEFRAPWDIMRDYVHPPTARDVSTGPGAWTWPDPDILPRRPLENLARRDASAPFAYLTGDPAGAAARLPTDPRRPIVTTGLRAPIRMQVNPTGRGSALTDGRILPRGPYTYVDGGGAVTGPTGGGYVQVPPIARPVDPGCRTCGDTTVVRLPSGGAVRCSCMAARSATTKPEEDEGTEFMVGTHAPGSGVVTTPGLGLRANAAARRAAARGKSVRLGGMGTGAVPAAEASVYGLPIAVPAPAAGGGVSIYGVAPASAVPPYDVPHAGVAALGAHNRYGLYKMPGTLDTTDALMRRDAAAQGVLDPYAPLPPAAHEPATDALGFRFTDRAQFGFNKPKFFPARDPVDKLLYETAAETAPDMAADLADFTVLRDMDMIEPLSSRWEAMRDIAREMSHTRDPYMVPRTGPSVLHPGRNAQPPDWYIPPGSSARGW